MRYFFNKMSFTKAIFAVLGLIIFPVDRRRHNFSLANFTYRKISSVSRYDKVCFTMDG